MGDREEKLISFVRKVATAPEGRWNNDLKQYLNNVITDTMDEAKKLLEELGMPVKEE